MNRKPQNAAPSIQLSKKIYWRTGAIFVGLCLLGSWIVSYGINRQIETEKQSTLQRAGSQASILAQHLNAGISLTYTLEILLSENHYRVDPVNFEHLATHLMQTQPAVSSLQYAPDGIVTHVVPLAGNEKIIGHDLFEDPKRNKEALAAVAEKKLTVAGPFELIQGGFALVARLPLFRNDTRERPFWGFSTVLIRIDDLLQISQFDELTADNFDWNLWRIHPDSGKPTYFAGTSKTAIQDAIELTIQVPNASWFLSVKPSGGWLPASLDRLIIEIILLLAIASAGAAFAYTQQRHPMILQQRVNTRTTELQEANQKLRDSEERFRLIFETNPTPVALIKQESRTIIDVNREFIATTGIPRDEALNHTLNDLRLWLSEQEKLRFWSQIENTGEVNNLEIGFQLHDGTKRIGLFSTRHLHIHGEPCLLIVIRDITTEKEAEEALVEMDRIKTEFISTAAHELSTPLSAMLGFTELLCDTEEFGEFSEAQRLDFLNEIYVRGEALNRIIGDLLDISRLESGRPLSLDLKETCFGNILEKTVDYFRLQSSGHSFRLELPQDIKKLTVKIDVQRICQVIENLLGNAIKYSPKGSEILLKGEIDTDAQRIVICCEDHGIGMSPEQVSQVFNKFYRADASNTAVGGLGLGMSIAKQIVENHGGDIDVESAPGKGTKVCFSLPLSE